MKKIAVPLFGVVEAANATAWHEAFAKARATIDVRVDEAALNVIAEELELDADCLAADAERYVSGTYRAKARGIGGSQLGALGEVITYLVSRGESVRAIQRVVSYRPGAGQPVKGSRFPQPDFIIEDANGVVAALEVKSTQAFDFVDLRDTAKKWTWLQPCSSVAGCRQEALAQLGFVAGAVAKQDHALVVRGKSVVAFPVGKGIAAAVLAVDGRTNILRTDQRFRTPPTCRQASRSCWSCVPSACHLVLVTLSNAPGMLALGGGAPEHQRAWLHSYQRWAQALGARDLLAVRATATKLVKAVRLWVDGESIVEPEVLRGFWGSHLVDAMRSRGLDVAVEGLDELGEWTRAPLGEPTSLEVSVDDVRRTLQRAPETNAPFLLSTRAPGSDGDTDTVAVRGDAAFVEFQMLSRTWWEGGAVGTTETASTIATRLVAFAQNASPGLGPPIDAIPLRELVANVGEDTVRLGWIWAADWSVATRDWARKGLWDQWLLMHLGPRWLAALMQGDPRVRLYVTPYGRACLRVARPLL